METTADIIIQKIEHSYAEILRFYQSVPVIVLLEPTLSNGWAVKDMLAHIAAWEWRCAFLLDEAHQTDVPLKAMPDVDALNREIYQERLEWSWEEVEADFREAHQRLLTSIQELPATRLNDETIQQAIAEETWEHYEEHIVDLKRWHKRVNR